MTHTRDVDQSLYKYGYKCNEISFTPHTHMHAKKNIYFNRLFLQIESFPHFASLFESIYKEAKCQMRIYEMNMKRNWTNIKSRSLYISQYLQSAQKKTIQTRRPRPSSFVWFGLEGIYYASRLSSAAAVMMIDMRKGVAAFEQGRFCGTYLKPVGFGPDSSIVSGDGGARHASGGQQLVVDVILPAHVEWKGSFLRLNRGTIETSGWALARSTHTHRHNKRVSEEVTQRGAMVSTGIWQSCFYCGDLAARDKGGKHTRRLL